VNNFCEVGIRTAGRDAGPPDAGLECEFGYAQCLNATTIRTCELGRFAEVDCTRNGLVCDEGFCRPAPCNPDGGSATRCLDLTTQETCTEPPVMTDCAAGEICWQGTCSKATGEGCTTDVECAGGFCHCKPTECTGALAAGYCSLNACNTTAAAVCPISDVCMGLASAGGTRANLCGKRSSASCPDSTDGQAAGYAGPFKRFMPIPDPANPLERYTFGDAVCFDRFPLPVGAACAGATECIGGSPTGFAGACSTFSNAVTSGYCTHACDQTHPCGPGSACANRPSDPAGAGVCVLMCSEQKAGLATCDRSGVTCKQPVAGSFTIVDGKMDTRGFCLP